VAFNKLRQEKKEVPETIEDRGSGPKWHWFNVMADLQKAGLPEISINPLSVTPYGCGGTLGKTRFYFSWVKDVLLILTMDHFDQRLVDAFAKVLEYRPFCRYDRDRMVTVEWTKEDPEKVIAKLQKDPTISGIARIS
jgi:hypothetical protein